jgi:CubicO group peptidase (beta-lactamase class C family)
MLSLYSQTIGRCVATVAILLATGAGAQAADPTKPVAQSVQLTATRQDAAFTAAFHSWLAANDPLSAILVVGHHGKVVFAQASNADVDGQSMIGSMSKAITGACVATLVRDGKLSFTTPMREVLAEFFRRNWRPIDPHFEDVTVEQLLTHRSGLHDNSAGDPLLVIRKERIAQHLADVAEPQPLLASYLSRNMLVNVPGRKFAYSNTGYLTLAVVIEERSGRPFEEYCRDEVFVPLGLGSAGLNPDWRMLGGYGGWYISGADYLKFYEIFDPAHRFLGEVVKSWIDSVHSRWGGGNEDEWYSLGVRTSAREGRWSVHHTGTLGWTGSDARGKPIAAIINGIASRTSSGTGIFIAVRRRPDVTSTDTRSEVFDLHREISQIAIHGGRERRN